jgi:hypothetical protein
MSDQDKDEKHNSEEDETGSDAGDAGNEVGMLSAETLRALREFALDSGVFVENTSVIESVRKHFEVKDREEVFKIDYTSKDEKRHVQFELKGTKRELGQTLDSTGLTMYVF